MKRTFRVVALMMLIVTLAMPLAVSADLVLPPGSGTTNIITQNMDATESASVVITYYDEAGNEDYVSPAQSIAPLAVYEFKSNQLPDDIPTGWMGSAVMSSDYKVGAMVGVNWQDAGPSGDGRAQNHYVGGMTGFNQLYMPDLKRATFADGSVNQVSKFYIQNTEQNAATVYINFYGRMGTPYGQKVVSIPGFAQKGIDMRDTDGDIPQAIIDDGLEAGAGSVFITSTNKIYGIAQTTFSRNNATLSWDAAYEGLAEASTMLYAPSAFRSKRDTNGDGNITEADAWNIYSAVVVQNTGDTAADIYFNYVNRTTGETDLQAVVENVAPLQSAGLNTRGGGDLDAQLFADNLIVDGESNWDGSMVITSTNPLVGMSNVMWAYSTQDYAGAYVLAGPEQAGNKIYVPAYYRRLPTGTWVQWSAINLVNVGEDTTIDVKFIDQNGATVASTTGHAFAAGAGIGINSRGGSKQIDAFNQANMETALGDDFIGGAYIEAPAGAKLICTVNTIYNNRSSVYNAFTE